MQVLITALVVAALGQVTAGSPAGGRYGDKAAASEAAAPDRAPEAGLAAQITVSSDTAQPTLSDAPSQEAATPAAPATPPANRPAQALAAPSQAAVTPTAPKTSALIRDWAKPPRTGQLSGVPITLAEALRGADTRQLQTDRTMGYWDLAAKVTQYYLVRRDALELAALRQGVTTPSPQWQAKALALQSEQELAQQSAEAAQLRFQQLLGRTTTSSLPLPADLPHCGKYATRYDEIFAGRTDPAAKQLDELLPLKYAELRNQSRLVSDAWDWLQQVSKARDPNSDGVGLLRAHELVSLRRRALVEAVRDYNQDIAAYTELAAPNDVGTERLVAMLIRVSNPAGGSREPSGVQQASATEDAASDRATPASASEDQPGASSPKPTFGPRSRLVRRPAFWRLRNREHSILVNRLRSRQSRD